jgi:hypothetical protein
MAWVYKQAGSGSVPGRIVEGETAAVGNIPLTFGV